MKKFGAILLVVVIITVVKMATREVVYEGVDMVSENIDQTFTEGEMSITLTQDFSKTESEGDEDYSIAVYASDDAAVEITKRSFPYLEELGYEPESLTLKEYAQVLIDSHEHTGSEVIEANGLTFYFYDDIDDADNAWKDQIIAFKSADAFWEFDFYCEPEDFETLQPDFIKWAQSVQFSDTVSADEEQVS